ncbi:amino acid adenylation protein [Micromonospora acroterricola]|uniref:Amino acid adenylation protein n=1 Tax=Micromonospora acroterricola TaxID=2202421 RepID=A0A317CRR5_9ACTN|nr:AMP-binding protein [Micromonospora acroterricola]PWR04912.1 amino acid adenylation protein [Micromonospora acroterricola]
MGNSTLIQRFGDAASARSDRPAVLGDTGALDYAALAGLAGGHADLLAAAGVRPGDRVGLLTPHGAGTIAAILGTLAAGAAYVPLDPGFPEQRLRHLLDGADVTVLLCGGEHTELARRLAADRPGLRVVPAVDVRPAPLRPVPVDADALAYVLFTSGSTGRPKAVGQTHRNLTHVVDNQIATLELRPDDRLSLLASFSFDAAIPDLYPALLTGAAVVPVDLRRHGLAYATEHLARHGVTVYHSTPTVYRYLLDTPGVERLDRVRVVLLGGEQATYTDAARARGRFAPGCVLVNGYGATEMTFAARYALPLTDVEPEATGPLPIGSALPGYALRLAPDGEIVVRGRHLAPGYLDQVSDRFGHDPDGVPVYRTGDLGELLPTGELRCLGRLDRQVKVRGFRVELTEIEAVLAAEPGVAEVRAIARDGELLAYVRSGGPPVDPATLRAALARQLPEYALPRAVVPVAAFPLTVSGKIDERALPDPARAVPPGDRPATPTERIVHDIWCAVLGRHAVGRTDSFFDVGGQSLLLGQVQQRLAERFGVAVPLLRLFDHPTVAAQARLVDPPAPTTPSVVAPAQAQAAVPPSAAGPPAAPGGVREYTGDEIAVVGLAGRFPGAPDVATFWWNLCAGVDAIHDHSDEELAALGVGPGLRADPRHVKATGRLDGVADFDAEFFAFGEREAARTDPQHRLFLETAWEALEDAGHDPARFPGLVGVYGATAVNRYFLFHLMDNPAVVGDVDPDDWEARLVGRQLTDHLPGQVAYRLGLTGPAVAVQSACSSSLVAVCLAAQSLADYQCDLALAGGVSVTWPRHRHTPGGLASPDGRCRAFDEGAQGAGFGSGVGVVALRRLADAQADGDRVLAILPGWAVTNDGADRAGYAVPGPAGQAAAVAGALAAAEVAPGEVRFIEAHGSGTPLGDAIEVAALHEVYQGAAPAETCALGSVKTTIGHLDAAAGIAGLIKAVLAVQHGVIPPNLHFTRPHPEIDLAAGPFYVPTKVRDWPEAPRRVAGVSSFGLGRREFGCRAAVVATDAAGAVAALDELLATDARVAGPAGALRELAATWVAGQALDWTALHPADGVRRTSLPTYPFQRQRYWIDPPQKGVR